METSECLCDWDTYIAVAFQHYGHGWGFPEQGLRQISMANCGFDAERRAHYHTQICYRVGCRSAFGGRERTCGSHDEKTGNDLFPRERARRRHPRVRDPCTERKESSTPSCFWSTPLCNFSVRVESINLADATRQCFLSWSKTH